MWQVNRNNLTRRISAVARILVAHSVNDNVHADLIGHYTVLRWIASVVDPLPGVTQVTVAGHENHEPPVLIFHAHVMRSHAVSLISYSVNQGCPARDLDHLVQIK